MIGKRLKKLITLGGLVAIREVWGLGCNLYLMTYQPRVVWKNLLEKKNRWQLRLVGGAAIWPTIGYLVARIGYDKVKYGFIQPGYGKVFWTAVGVQVLVGWFWGYWFYRTIKNK